jgi:hypothetical protein
MDTKLCVPLQTQHSNTTTLYTGAIANPTTEIPSSFMTPPLLDGIGFEHIRRERFQTLPYEQHPPLSLLEFSSSSSPMTFAALKMGTPSNDLQDESTPIANDEAAVILRPNARKRHYASDQDLFQGLMCPVFRPSTAKNLDAVTKNSFTTPRPMKKMCRGSAAPDIALGGRCNGGGPHTQTGSKNIFISGVSLLQVPDFDLRSWIDQEVDISSQPEADARQTFSVMSQMQISQSKVSSGGEEPSLSRNSLLVPAFSLSLISNSREHLPSTGTARLAPSASNNHAGV